MSRLCFRNSAGWFCYTSQCPEMNINYFSKCVNKQFWAICSHSSNVKALQACGSTKLPQWLQEVLSFFPEHSDKTWTTSQRSPCELLLCILQMIQTAADVHWWWSVSKWLLVGLPSRLLCPVWCHATWILLKLHSSRQMDVPSLSLFEPYGW